LLLVF